MQHIYNKDFVYQDTCLEKYTGNETCIILPETYTETIFTDAFAGKNIQEMTITNLTHFCPSVCELEGCEHLKLLRVRFAKSAGRTDVLKPDPYELTQIFPGLERLEILCEGHKSYCPIEIAVDRLDSLPRHLQIVLDDAALENLNEFEQWTLIEEKKTLLVPISHDMFETRSQHMREGFSLCFLKKPEVYPDPEQYLSFLRKNGLKIFTEQLQADNTAALLSLLRNPQFTGFTYSTYEKLLQLADEKSMVEVRAALLDSCHRFYDEEKEQARKDRKMLTQIMDPYNTQIMSKLWSWETNSTGVTLTRHKPSAQNSYGSRFSGDVEIPPMVGKKNVTAIRNMFASHGKYGRITVPDSVQSLGTHAFSNLIARKLVLPDTLDNIQDHAFQDAKIEFFHLPARLREIADNAFTHAYIQHMDTDLPDGLEVIGDFAFLASNIRAMRIPEHVRRIGRGLFQSCCNLEEAFLPNSLYSVPEDCFRFCEKLSEVHIPEQACSIQARAFANCTSLKSLDIPETVLYIGLEAFSRSALSTPDLEHVITISPYAFLSCANLRAIHVPAAMQIGDSAFEKSGIVSVSAERLPAVMEQAFHACCQLKEAYLPSVTAVLDRAFSGCTALETLHAGRLSIVGTDAFQGCTALREMTFPKDTDLDAMRTLLQDKIPESVQLRHRT